MDKADVAKAWDLTGYGETHAVLFEGMADAVSTLRELCRMQHDALSELVPWVAAVQAGFSLKEDSPSVKIRREAESVLALWGAEIEDGTK